MASVTKSTGVIIDFTPVIGHAKGVVHYASRDKERDDQVLDSATRTNIVVAASVTGFAGPIGAGALGASATVITAPSKGDKPI